MAGNGMGAAWERHGMSELVGITQIKPSKTTRCATVDLAADRKDCIARTNVKTNLFQVLYK
jgi:hypothetical protein